ncbi:Bis(5'-nucleosyl)-tetraphosphatase [asymmetrical] [Vanrija pseudolonga]|uniref:Bis(5'-adenosyl)-triphosphatase n=1 Tax=Vanrija pseudolonga TaxID=143232 RepID=A0AAF0Y3H0_9TREE|nr:Bis(5'-nucleosyl)-tetraphosphatase [asymmetrical] [Vanrija pseudolonga]
MGSAARYLFSVFDITRQVFFETPLSLGIVNLKPLRPGHVLIISKRVVPRLADLEPREVSDLFQTVQRVGRVIESAYKAEALNIALQDGTAAGQSVPHVHVHIIPRLRTDFGGKDTDKVYPLLERSEAALDADLAAGPGDGSQRPATPFTPSATHDDIGGWDVPPDAERKPRSADEMEAEASWLSGLLAAAGVQSSSGACASAGNRPTSA